MNLIRIIALFTLLCTASLLGCNSNSAIAGKYYDKNYPDNYTELKSDGTFIIHQSNMKATGRYAVNNGAIILTLDNGEVFEGRIEGNVLIGNRGSRSIKEE